MKIIEIHNPVSIGKEWTKIDSTNFPFHLRVLGFIRNFSSSYVASLKEDKQLEAGELYNSLQCHENEVVDGIVYLLGQKSQKECGYYATETGIENFKKFYIFFKNKHKKLFSSKDVSALIAQEELIKQQEAKKEIRAKIEEEREAKNEKIRQAILDRISNSVHSHKIKRYAEIYKIELGTIEFQKKICHKDKSDCIFILKMIRYYFPKFPPITTIDDYFIENVKNGILQKLEQAYTSSQYSPKDTIEIERNAIAVYCIARIRHYMTDYDKLMDAEIKKLGEENKSGIQENVFFRMMLPRIESIKAKVRKQVQGQVESIAKEMGIVFHNQENSSSPTSSPTSTPEATKSVATS